MVNRELFDQYRNALGVSADLAERAVAFLVTTLAQTEEGYDIQDLRLGYEALVKRYGKLAAQVAVEFYQAVRDSQGVTDEFEPQEYTNTIDIKTASDVQRAWDSSDTQKQLAAIIAQRVMECADNTIIRNAWADPAHPRYALVAHSGACGWCRMLASNGFTYSGENKVELSRHSGCKCAVCVEFSKHPALQGYDTTQYRKQYQNIREQAVAEAKEQWANMSPEERKAAARKGRGGYDRILRNRITANMDAGRSHQKAE